MLKRGTQLVPLSVIKTIEAYSMFATGDTVLVAFSGGPDSTALVHILMLQSERYGIKLHLAYLNHNLRGAESAEEQRFVEAMAEQLGLPIETRALTEQESQELSKGSLESRARAVRRAFLEETASRVGANKIATGHTFDDQVETLLMRLFVGTGQDGFAGIRAVSGLFVRPLIDTPKESLLKFLGDNAINYVQDSTNLGGAALRNRIRHRLVPAIDEVFGPHASAKLVSFSKLVARDSQVLDEIAQNAYQQASCEVNGRPALLIESLRGMRPAVRNRVVRKMLFEIGLPRQSINAQHIATVAAIAASHNPEARTKLPGAVSAARHGDAIVFGAPDPAPSTYPPFQCELRVPGSAEIPSRHRRVVASAVETPAGAVPESKMEALLAADICLECGPELILRSAGDQDTFIPLGMGQQVRVYNFLKRQKVPRHERTNYPLITRRDGVVLWVVGQRIDNRARITETSRGGVRLTLRHV